jgi:tetratricopeptide (TPR) repeat protein
MLPVNLIDLPVSLCTPAGRSGRPNFLFCYDGVDFLWNFRIMYRSSWFLMAALVGTNVALGQNIVQARPTYELATIARSSVKDVARSVTVKIRLQRDESSGSGVLIHRQGDLYTLVTNSHVTCGANLKPDRLCERLPTQEEFSLELLDPTPGSFLLERYTLPPTNVKILSNDLDLAIIQFRSSINYPIAKLADLGSLQINQPVYTAGFPPSGFSFYSGETIAVANRKLAGDVGGYTMIYSATTVAGMSGGGVFDANGQLVGIQGRGNTSKIGSSRGIPISFVARKLALIGINIAGYSRTEPALVPPFTAEEYFVAGYNKFVDPGSNPLTGTQQAIKYFSWAIQLQPRYTFAYFRRAYAYDQVQELQKSLSDYNQAILLNPRYVEAYNGRANLKGEKLNDLTGALADYNMALALDSRYAEAYNGRAVLKGEKLNDLAGALADYNMAILSNPKLAEAYNGRAILKAGKLRDVSGALLDYNQAIAISPEYSDAYYNRAVLKAGKMNDLNGALADYNRAIVYNPKDIAAYNNRANLKDRLNDLQGSLADYNQAISLSPQYANAYFNRANLKRNRLADTAGAIQDYRQAARLYRQQAKTADLQDTLRILQQLGATE